MADVRILYPDRISRDTVQCCATLTREARLGNLTGLAFIGYVQRHGYIADACGDAYREAALSLVYLRDLDARLADLVKGGLP